MKSPVTGFGQRRYRTRLRHHSGWPELTALADILFLSLLFFVIASTSVRVSGIEVKLPEADTLSSAVLERYVVSLTPVAAGGTGVNIYFREKRCGDLGELRQELAELRRRHADDVKVIIRADRETSYEALVEVIDVCRGAGVWNFSLATANE